MGMLSVDSVCLPGAELVAELAQVDELDELRLAHDELGAALDRLVLVREAVGERVPRVVRPLDDLEQLAPDEVHQSHSAPPRAGILTQGRAIPRRG